MLLHDDDKNFKGGKKIFRGHKFTQQCFRGLKMQICENGDICTYVYGL